MNWQRGLARFRRVGIAMTGVGALMLMAAMLTGWFFEAIPGLNPFWLKSFTLSLGLPLTLLGALFWALSWILQGFLPGPQQSR